MRGSLATHQDHWRIGNQGSVRLIVENVKRPDEYFGVVPGQVEVPVPFELARVMAAHDLEAQLVVLGPDHGGDGGSPESASGDTPVVNLDHGTAYYAVLQALCESRLRYGPESPLPTSSQIASALCSSGYRLTSRAVDAHIDYLLDKLDVRPATDLKAGRGWKREILVTRALRLGLVAVPVAYGFSDSQ